MADIEAIKQALLDELESRGQQEVAPGEAEEWLAARERPPVHDSTPGKNVRDLLRERVLPGHQNEAGQWIISIADLTSTPTTGYEYEDSMQRPHAWVVRVGKGANLLDDFRNHAVIAIGFQPVGDLRGLDSDQIADCVVSYYPDAKWGALQSYTHQLRAFALGIQPGVLIPTPTAKRSEVLIGRVTSEYRYDSTQTGQGRR